MASVGPVGAGTWSAAGGWSAPDLLAAVEAAWTSAYGEVQGRGSVDFVGVPPMQVLRFGPDGDGPVRYATPGMSRMPMTDPRATVVDPLAGLGPNSSCRYRSGAIRCSGPARAVGVHRGRRSAAQAVAMSWPITTTTTPAASTT